ncbi:hypothetical protein [Pilimelia columellifera]|uniref:hypothetical protein n=1 Tax=Pilimelia columellifera TaxID=706574 RepID=UPI0031E3F720
MAEPTAPASAPPGRLAGPAVAPLVGAGLAALTVSVAFAAARAGAGWAHPVYWAGQLLLIGAVAAAVLSPRVSPAGRLLAVFGFTAAQFVIKLAYAPLRFRFADELQHWQTTLGMADAGRQFPTNHSLPISPRFPGLETLTLTVMRATGLSFHPAAVLVCAASAMLLTAALLLLLREVTSRPELLTLAALVYLCNPNHGFFTAMFLYTAPALPMLALCLTQAVSLLRQPAGPARRLAAGLLFAGAVVVAHHLTMVVALALLTLAAAAGAAIRRLRPAARPLATLAGGAWALAAAWVWLVAPQVVDYLGGPLVALAQTFARLGAVRPDVVAGSAGAKPLVETALSLAAILVLAGATAALGWWALRARRLLLAATMAAVTAVEGAIVVIRVVSPRGEELAGRAPAYLTLLVALALALGLAQLPPATLAGRRWRLGVGAALMVVFCGGLTAGWPPYWLRLPGRHLPAGYEAAVDTRTMELGWWSRRRLPAGGRFVADFGNQTVVGTIGGLDPVGHAAALFHRPGFDYADRSAVQDLRIRYVVADRRLTQVPAPRGSYFLDPPPSDADPTRPLPAGALEKFAAVEGVGVTFDDGVIRVYDLSNSRYAW